MDKRDPVGLAELFAEADFILMKKYQYELSSFPVLRVPNEIASLEIEKQTRLFLVESIAYDKEEDTLIKLSNVYNALSSVKGSAVIILDSNKEQVKFYIGTKTEETKDILIAQETLGKSLLGNFPGCKVESPKSAEIKSILEGVFKFKDDNSAEVHRVVSAVNGISALRKVNLSGKKKEFAQGIEKLIDAMKGEIYSVLLIADPIAQKQIDTIRDGYEQLYTNLIPYANREISIGVNIDEVLTKSLALGVDESFSKSLTRSQGHSHTTAKTTEHSVGVGASGPFMIKQVPITVNANYTHSRSRTESDTDSWEISKQRGISVGNSLNASVSAAKSFGQSLTTQLKWQEKPVISLLERIDEQLKRLDECGDLGMWNCAAYFIADNEQISKIAAASYQALIRGENSGIEAININTWKYDENDQQLSENYLNLVDYLKKLYHPKIDIGCSVPFVTPTSLISGTELTLQAGLPQKSVLGLVVSEYAAFGRNLLKKNIESIQIGLIHHMGKDEEQSVDIDCQSLTAHTLITGSTGSGKSNIIYNILNDLSQKEIPFLVIEPAKGEYKNVFGNREDVEVFGTNPRYTKLLKINPFKFPEGVHVLEHADRIIEIFNFCWPLYAAMPAILKDAVLLSYEDCGWNLTTSKNEYSQMAFPTFQDLLAQLESVIEYSDYSLEVKSNYRGALLTRIRSLTNGLYGQIFSDIETDNQILFDKSVIVDLSRVGAFETKSLIMGVLIMRLSEHRMTNSTGMNQPLKHITVLEEAHNILKRSSNELQNSEGSNISAKSVELLSNAIAEMRTFGEGFIISDQSPNALDISAIRNTNTKIIFRLPDEMDRRLAGKSAALKDEQLDEITKLPKGVAAVYQNQWLEPVLCKSSKFDGEFDSYQYASGEIEDDKINNGYRTELLKLLLQDRYNKREFDFNYLNGTHNPLNISTKNKIRIAKIIDEFPQCGYTKIWQDEQPDVISEIVSEVIGGKTHLDREFKNNRVLKEKEEFNRSMFNYIDSITFKLPDEDIKLSILKNLLKKFSKESEDKLKFYENWKVIINGKGKN